MDHYINAAVDNFILSAILGIMGLFLFLILLKSLFKKGLFATIRNRERDNSFIDRLENYMIEMKPYRKPELSRQDLAEGLEVSPDFLTQMLNRKLEMNFREYINRYRVEEVKSLIKKDLLKEQTLEALGYAAGFSSRSTFFRVFKTLEGTTPLKYANTLHND
ncbi:helix-turn-helix domain-containing protein [Aureisphaera galaxeae]|uniref:helix-turn-helix domain-containing protein n=1 Tax=Aureisphaera galaxeae TaxID=1538023 RepID=UPI00235014E6|nr:helix-turn-helix domain-containing protein [Aureisphaera galaxeae]MDC8004627.1 helix-turn-helix domain-containing protein [Aureisphaera galaxeae]